MRQEPFLYFHSDILCEISEAQVRGYREIDQALCDYCQATHHVIYHVVMTITRYTHNTLRFRQGKKRLEVSTIFFRPLPS